MKFRTLPHLLAMIVLAALFASAGAQTTEPASAPSSVPAEFESFGLRITPPTEWKRLPENQTPMVARWAVPTPGAPDQPAAVVSVEIQPARGRTSEMYGKELAQQLKGKLDPVAEIAGTKAARITADIGDAANPRPMEALVARNDQYVYIISAATSAGGVAHTQALQDIRAGIEFVQITSPTSYLELRSEPVQLFGKFKIKLLATLRPSPEQRPAVVQLRTMNYRRNRADLLVTLETLKVSDPAATLEEVGNQVAASAGAKDVQITWKEIPGTPRRVVSSTFQVPGKQLMIRLGLVQLKPGEVAMINFGLSTPDEFDRVLYQDKCDQMLQSVEVLGATPATAPQPNP